MHPSIALQIWPKQALDDRTFRCRGHAGSPATAGETAPPFRRQPRAAQRCPGHRRHSPARVASACDPVSTCTPASSSVRGPVSYSHVTRGSCDAGIRKAYHYRTDKGGLPRSALGGQAAWEVHKRSPEKLRAIPPRGLADLTERPDPPRPAQRDRSPMIRTHPDHAHVPPATGRSLSLVSHRPGRWHPLPVIDNELSLRPSTRVPSLLSVA